MDGTPARLRMLTLIRRVNQFSDGVLLEVHRGGDAEGEGEADHEERRSRPSRRWPATCPASAGSLELPDGEELEAPVGEHLDAGAEHRADQEHEDRRA